MAKRKCPECGRDLSYERTCADYDTELIYEYWKCYHCGYSCDWDGDEE
jgi:endogenous inhibitor of DNA gyrase (YacG/DUF329 family)